MAGTAAATATRSTPRPSTWSVVTKSPRHQSANVATAIRATVRGVCVEVTGDLRVLQVVRGSPRTARHHDVAPQPLAGLDPQRGIPRRGADLIAGNHGLGFAVPQEERGRVPVTDILRTLRDSSEHGVE